MDRAGHGELSVREDELVRKVGKESEAGAHAVGKVQGQNSLFRWHGQEIQKRNSQNEEK